MEERYAKSDMEVFYNFIVQGYKDFKCNYKVINWWYALIPSVIAMFIVMGLGNIGWYGLGILLMTYLSTYLAKVKIEVFENKEVKNFTESIKGLNLVRDGLTLQVLALVQVLILGVVTFGSLMLLLMVTTTDSSLLIIFAVFIILFSMFFIKIYMSAPSQYAPYLLVKDAESDYKTLVKKSYIHTILNEDFMVQYFLLKFFEAVGYLLSLLLMGIPLVFVVPYVQYLKAKLYLSNIEDQKYEGKVKVEGSVVESEYKESGYVEDLIKEDENKLTSEDICKDCDCCKDCKNCEDCEDCEDCECSERKVVDVEENNDDKEDDDTTNDYIIKTL